MADRLLVFADPEVQKLLKEKFIAVTGDDWYQRRREDEVGRFFLGVVEQSPRKGNHTKQGHYVFTAGGKFLGFNNNRGPERRLTMMKEALKRWETVRESEEALKIPDRGKNDSRYHRELPEGGQIVKVYTRCLEERDGRLQKMDGDKVGNQAAVDHLWLRKEDIARLEKFLSEGGGDLPDWLFRRMARFHLRDNTRGEPRDWKDEEIRDWLIQVDGDGKISGGFLINSQDASMGYEGKVSGTLKIKDGRLSTFDLLVQGEHWGNSTYTKGSRPGKNPIGQVFRLVDGKSPGDRIPPQGIRWSPGYWGDVSE